MGISIVTYVEKPKKIVIWLNTQRYWALVSHITNNIHNYESNS